MTTPTDDEVARILERVKRDLWDRIRGRIAWGRLPLRVRVWRTLTGRRGDAR